MSDCVWYPSINCPGVDITFAKYELASDFFSVNDISDAINGRLILILDVILITFCTVLLKLVKTTDELTLLT